MGTEERQRAVVVSRNLPPLTGGMERLNLHAYRALRQRFDVAVCGPVGFQSFADPSDRCREVASKPLAQFLASCQWHAWRLAARFRPQLVYSGSGLTAPAALVAARAVGAPVACFLHGLDIVADHPVYRALFLPAIRRCDRILVNSRYTEELALRIGVASDRIRIVHPGVELPDWSARDGARGIFRSRFGLGERPLLLAVGRLTERKGLAPFIRNALPTIVRRIPEVMLIVIGQEASHALKHRPGVVQQIESAVRDAGMGAHVTLLGAVDDASLSAAYFASDLCVFPVRDGPGDVEGFGMVAIEAAAHGLPTVAFNVGGVGDAVSEGHSGWLIQADDYAAMADTVIAGLDRLQNGTARALAPESIRSHAERFAWEIFDSRLLASLPNPNAGSKRATVD